MLRAYTRGPAGPPYAAMYDSRVLDLSDAGIVCDRFIDWSVKNWHRPRGRVTLRIRMADESPHCADIRMSLDIPSVINVTDETEPVLLRLVPALAGLGPRALAILADIAERLQRGARQYGGDFDDKPRDWRREANEEALDYMVYMTMAYMEERERRAADEARQKAAVRLHDQTLASLAGTPTLSRPPRRQTDPTKPVIESFHTPVSACGCYVCAPEAREDWEKTRDGCG